MPRGIRRTGGSQGGRPGPKPGFAGAAGALHNYRNQLMQQREQIENQLQAIEQVLNGMGAPMPRMAEAGGMRRGPGRPPGGGAMAARMVSGGRGGRGGRAPRAGSLKEYILRVLRQKGGTMAVKDITAGVTRAGYKSKNQTLAKSVGIALTELPGVEKVGRGQFQLT